MLRGLIRRAAMCALGVLLLPVLADAAEPVDCPAPPATADGWPTAAAAREGLDPALICATGPDLARDPKADAHGVVAARHGRIVYEHYFPGEDARWPEEHWGEPFIVEPHDADTLHDVQSITKSVVALLVGIALDRGSIEDVDVPVATLLPDEADVLGGAKGRITLRDLLTMTSGLAWPVKPYLTTARLMDASADPYRFVLAQPLVRKPGAEPHYNNGSVEVVGAIVKAAVGRPLDAFAKEALFDPLGIDRWDWGRMANGDPGASWGLRLRPRDLAKIGQLVLDKGLWQGRRIVSADWIARMTAPQVVRRDFDYGYLWWRDRVSAKGRTFDLVEAIGWGGQYLYICPQEDLVVVVTAGLYDFSGESDQGLAAEAVLNNHVLPAIADP